MSSPPDKPHSSTVGSVHAAQLAASNQTVNRFLGLRPPRPWMVEGQQPSPAIKSTSVASRSSQRRVTSSAREPPPGSRKTVAQTKSTASDESILPSPALTNEPSPAISTRHASPSGIPGEPQTPSAEHASLRLEHTIRNANAMANGQGVQSPDNTYTTTTLRQTAQGTSEARQAASHLQPQCATTRTTPNGPSPSPTGKRPADPSVTVPQQHKRPRQNPANQINLPCEWPPQNGPDTIREWGRKIEERVMSCGGLAHLLKVTEGHRYRYLMNACVENDVFYLHLHQVFCLWSRNVSLVHALFHTLSPEVIDRTFKVLLQVLRQNSSMALHNLVWFSEFPNPKPPALPHPITLLIETFIRAMFDNWGSLITLVRDRGFPMTAFEAINSLSCRSTILQNSLFVVSRRTIGVPDQFSRDLDLLFHQDQRLEASFLGTPTPGNHILEARTATCAQYLSASNEARKQASAQVSGVIAQGRALDSNVPTTQSQQHLQNQPQNQLQNQLENQLQREQSHREQLQHPQQQQVPQQQWQQQQGQQQWHQQQRQQMQRQGHLLHEQPHHEQQQRRQSDFQQQQHTQQQTLQEQQAQQQQAQQQQAQQQQAQQQQARQQHALQQQHAGPYPPIASQVLRSNGGPGGFPFYSQPHAQMPPPQFAMQPNQSQLQGPPIYNSNCAQGPPQYPGQGMQPQDAPGGPNSVNVWTGGAVPYPMRNAPNYQHTTAQNITDRQTPNHLHDQSQVGVTQLTPASAPTTMQNAATADQPGATDSPEAIGSPVARSRTPSRRIPEQEYPSSQYDWTCVHSALHLVGLHSPTRRPYVKARSRYFQFVSSLVVPPTRIPQKLGLSTLEFDLSKEDIAKVSKISSESLDDHPTAHYSNYSRRYRLRLSKSLTQDDTIKESDWMVLPSHWPEEIYISFNNEPKMLRRKQHFHSDLPMELSDVVLEGKNVVMISLPPDMTARGQTQNNRYFMAVEMIATVKEEDIVAMIEGMAQIPAQKTLEEIDRRLSPPDSDDVVAEDNSLNISLTDPFSFKTVNTAIRGVDCKHLECFDLRTWLETRPRKPTKHGRKEPSLIDVWKCPICDRDARPNNLRVDGFLTRVLADLVAKGKGSTKRIRVVPGGSWEPIVEPDDSDDEDLKPAKSSQAGPRPTVPTIPAEVVVLDD